MKYETLKVGDVRQKGDEVRTLTPMKSSYEYHGHPLDAEGAFRPVNLVGHAILVMDVKHLEFRRPV